MSHLNAPFRLFTFTIVLQFGGLLATFTDSSNAQQLQEDQVEVEFFEKQIRPLLIERCIDCHGPKEAKGNLRLDSLATALRGGDSGPAIARTKPAESRLIQAVRHENGLEMPPDGKLSDKEIENLTRWIARGAIWPGGTGEVQVDSSGLHGRTPLLPNSEGLVSQLQLWLAADSINLNDGELVYIWPDRSGLGRDVTATRGVRSDGVGAPGKFSRQSLIMQRPAVRFDTQTGFASSPDSKLDIHGDAAVTISVVVNLQPNDAQPPFDGIVGIGNPANPSGDPGKPLAALIQINKGEDHALHFAGGWNHDASLGPGSFKPYYNQPTLITIVKEPGPIRTTTRIYLNGELAKHVSGNELEGRDTIPDIQHRADIGAYLGKAVSWAGSIQGDIGEVIVFNKALAENERQGLETYLAEKFGLMHPGLVDLAERPQFSVEEKSHWAYQPMQRPTLPEVQNAAWVKTPVDRFVLAKLEEKGLAPSSPAAKLELLRRVTFDLIGLPPTVEEVDEFLRDESPEAYSKVVERLLSSPHYGEKWGRHWLDVVRYGESTANDANAVMRYAWRYRNYVVDSFNSDMPYDQFLREQLAGDLIPEPAIDGNGNGTVAPEAIAQSRADKLRRTIATGFLMVGPKALAETDKEQSRLDIVDDQIDVVGRAVLGLTIGCARCHDHKFDPIRTTDYYALAGIFRSTEPFQNENRNATMWWEYELPSGEPGSEEKVTVMAPKESTPRNLKVHIRGNRFTLGKGVARGGVSIVEDAFDWVPQELKERFSREGGSGRLALADWITHRQNPLTARVIVNRIWQHHFGRALVATSDNFGTRGEKPTHPELLDWLATALVENGWKLKEIHRVVVLSATYQQSVRSSGEPDERDPDLRWLSSYPRRRLSAEEIRDAMLAVSGKLDAAPGGNESGEYLFSKAEDINAQIRPNRVAADDPFYTDFTKRSIYLPVVRNMLPDVLALFDGADPNNVTAVRNETTVASQALFMMNSRFVREQAKGFAARVLGDSSKSNEERLQLAHQLAFGRRASSVEVEEGLAFLVAYQATAREAKVPEETLVQTAWQSYCQTLLCANEFCFVE